MDSHSILPYTQSFISIIVDAREMIQDSGPWYHEFHGEANIKEPWNAFSSLFFLVPVFYWVWRLHGEYRKAYYDNPLAAFANNERHRIYPISRLSEFRVCLVAGLDACSLNDDVPCLVYVEQSAEKMVVSITNVVCFLWWSNSHNRFFGGGAWRYGRQLRLPVDRPFVDSAKLDLPA